MTGMVSISVEASGSIDEPQASEQIDWKPSVKITRIQKHHGKGERLPSRLAAMAQRLCHRNTRAHHTYTPANAVSVAVVVRTLFVDWCSATGSAPLLLESADSHSASSY